MSERETLHRELTHRVKSHLRIMSGLISMEAQDPALTAPSLAELMQGRLRVLEEIYDSMSRAGAGRASPPPLSARKSPIPMPPRPWTWRSPSIPRI